MTRIRAELEPKLAALARELAEELRAKNLTAVEYFETIEKDPEGAQSIGGWWRSFFDEISRLEEQSEDLKRYKAKGGGNFADFVGHALVDLEEYAN